MSKEKNILPLELHLEPSGTDKVRLSLVVDKKKLEKFLAGFQNRDNYSASSNTESSSLEKELLSYLANLDVKYGIKKYPKYTTICCEPLGQVRKKSAFYFHTGRDGQLYLSFHNNIGKNIYYKLSHYFYDKKNEELKINVNKFYVPGHKIKIFIQTILEKIPAEVVKNYKSYTDEILEGEDLMIGLKNFIQILNLRSGSNPGDILRDIFLPPVLLDTELEEYRYAKRRFDYNYYDPSNLSVESFEQYCRMLLKHNSDFTLRFMLSDYGEGLFEHLLNEKTILVSEQDTRFPNTSRFIFSDIDDLDSFLAEVSEPLEKFLLSNGDLEPEPVF